jgi:hypothetical protein
MLLLFLLLLLLLLCGGKTRGRKDERGKKKEEREGASRLGIPLAVAATLLRHPSGASLANNTVQIHTSANHILHR